MSLTPAEATDLVDYRHLVEALYTSVRAAPPSEAAWREWCENRDQLFRSHPQSPIPPARRTRFGGLPYFPYDTTWRLSAEVQATAGEFVDVTHSGTGSTGFLPIGVASLQRGKETFPLTVYWLTGYGGGIFVPFRDATSGTDTYGGGRYLLDTVKGADLGRVGIEVVFDFNYAYHPSCVYDPQWSCPLSPRDNHVGLPITAGERLEP